MLLVQMNHAVPGEYAFGQSLSLLAVLDIKARRGMFYQFPELPHRILGRFRPYLMARKRKDVVRRTCQMGKAVSKRQIWLYYQFTAFNVDFGRGVVGL